MATPDEEPESASVSAGQDPQASSPGGNKLTKEESQKATTSTDQTSSSASDPSGVGILVHEEADAEKRIVFTVTLPIQWKYWHQGKRIYWTVVTSADPSKWPNWRRLVKNVILLGVVVILAGALLAAIPFFLTKLLQLVCIMSGLFTSQDADPTILLPHDDILKLHENFTTIQERAIEICAFQQHNTMRTYNITWVDLMTEMQNIGAHFDDLDQADWDSYMYHFTDRIPFALYDYLSTPVEATKSEQVSSRWNRAAKYLEDTSSLAEDLLRPLATACHWDWLSDRAKKEDLLVYRVVNFISEESTIAPHFLEDYLEWTTQQLSRRRLVLQAILDEVQSKRAKEVEPLLRRRDFFTRQVHKGLFAWYDNMQQFLGTLSHKILESRQRLEEQQRQAFITKGRAVPEFLTRELDGPKDNSNLLPGKEHGDGAIRSVRSRPLLLVEQVAVMLDRIHRAAWQNSHDMDIASGHVDFYNRLEELLRGAIRLVAEKQESFETPLHENAIFFHQSMNATLPLRIETQPHRKILVPIKTIIEESEQRAQRLRQVSNACFDLSYPFRHRLEWRGKRKIRELQLAMEQTSYDPAHLDHRVEEKLTAEELRIKREGVTEHQLLEEEVEADQLPNWAMLSPFSWKATCWMCRGESSRVTNNAEQPEDQET